jgi:hypothetical protein
MQILLRGMNDLLCTFCVYSHFRQQIASNEYKVDGGAVTGSASELAVWSIFCTCRGT